MSLFGLLRDWYNSIRGEKKGEYRYIEGEDGARRHHDPHWYEDRDDSVADGLPEEWNGAEPDNQGRLRNETDYPLPQWWGQLPQMVDAGVITQEEMWQRRSEWMEKYRVWRQINRQYDGGMWDQWDVERLRAGLSGREVAEELQSDYKHDGGSDD